MSGSRRCIVDRGGHARRARPGAAIVLVLVVGLFSAQPALASTLSGHVTASGQPVAGAFVAATGPSGQAGAVSDASGAFSLTLPDGTYRLASDAPGFAAAVADGVAVSGASTHDVALTASGAKLVPVPVFGGGRGQMPAGGSPGVFYDQGAAVGQIYRTLDWGGTWTQVTVARDDTSSGLPGTQIPDPLTTSGYPGEVTVNIGGQDGGVFVSTDYGVTWRRVAGSPGCGAGGGCHMLWGHAGSRSVLMYVKSQPYTLFVADMTAASPSFVQMTAPYGAAGQPLAVGNGGDRPWLATVDSSGVLSVSELVAQATAPAATLTLAGFPANPVAVGIGGAGAAGTPPAGVVVQSADAVTMTIKAPGDATYPAPPAAQSTSCGTGPPGVPAAPALVTPNTAASYGAAATGGCWVQDTGGTLAVNNAYGNGIRAIDAGYDATSSSPGTDAVVFVPAEVSRGPVKLASIDGGNPTETPTNTTANPWSADNTLDAKAGTDPTSGGVAFNGITSPVVFGTVFGPAGPGQIASAMDTVGVASDDQGASFHIAVYQPGRSVAWWQGASGSWLLFGHLTHDPGGLGLSGFLNWTSATPALSVPNVSGSDCTGLAQPCGQGIGISALAGVPGADTAFVGSASSNGDAADATGAVRRVAVNAGPSFSNVTPIGDGVITNAVRSLAYCPSAGSASSIQDVLLVIAGNTAVGGQVYRVTDATAASPTVTKVEDLAMTQNGPGLRPKVRADCASGTVFAASGSTADGLQKSTDGGQSFTKVPIVVEGTAPPGQTIGPPTTLQMQVEAIAITPGNPDSVMVGGDVTTSPFFGEIVSTSDGGQTWVVQNDPATGQNFAGPEIWDLVAPPAAAGAAASIRYGTGINLRAAPVGRNADLVAGAGEFSGNLAAPKTTPTPTPAPTPTATAPSISAFKLTHARFRVAAKPTAISARVAAKAKPRKPKVPRGSAFVYTLSAASTATIVIEHKTIGRKVGRKCIAKTKANARKKRCALYTVVRKQTAARRVGKKCVPVTKANAHKKHCTIHRPAGTLTRRSKAGKNTVAFSGRIGHTALTAGSYRATITARIGTGPRSKSRAAKFTIVKG